LPKRIFAEVIFAEDFAEDFACSGISKVMDHLSICPVDRMDVTADFIIHSRVRDDIVHLC